MEFKCRNYKENFWRTYSTRWIATESRTNRKTTRNKIIKTLFISPETGQQQQRQLQRAKGKKQRNMQKTEKKTVTQTLNRCEHLPFLGGLVAILNGLCSLTAAGPAIVTAYICCCCSSNNIKYTYTYNLPRAAPRWEVVQGLWRPKLGEWTARSRRTNEATNQKKGQDVLISMYTYTSMHGVCVCACGHRYLCVCVSHCFSRSKTIPIFVVISLKSYNKKREAPFYVNFSVFPF